MSLLLRAVHVSGPHRGVNEGRVTLDMATLIIQTWIRDLPRGDSLEFVVSETEEGVLG